MYWLQSHYLILSFIPNKVLSFLGYRTPKSTSESIIVVGYCGRFRYSLEGRVEIVIWMSVGGLDGLIGAVASSMLFYLSCERIFSSNVAQEMGR